MLFGDGRYRIREFPEGCGFWECAADAVVACVCFPCAISQVSLLYNILLWQPSYYPRPSRQMARHVFQYQRWDPEIGMYLGDPYHLLPLENDVRRPTVRRMHAVLQSTYTMTYSCICFRRKRMRPGCCGQTTVRTLTGRGDWAATTGRLRRAPPATPPTLRVPSRARCLPARESHPWPQ